MMIVMEELEYKEIVSQTKQITKYYLFFFIVLIKCDESPQNVYIDIIDYSYHPNKCPKT